LAQTRDQHREYMRTWRAQRKAQRAQHNRVSVAPVVSAAPAPTAPVPSLHEVLWTIPKAQTRVAWQSQIIHPAVEASAVCWACKGTRYSSPGVPCSYCNDTLAPSLKIPFVPQELGKASAQSAPDLGGLVWAVPLVLGGGILGGVWLWDKARSWLAPPVKAAAPALLERFVEWIPEVFQ
jgi:hypothetical protein